MSTRHRRIYSLQLDISDPPGASSSQSCQLIVPLGRNGNSCGRNGRLRPPKQRSIDLPVGDDVMVEGCWRKVLAIAAYRENWLSAEQVAEVEDQQRYLVQSPADVA